MKLINLLLSITLLGTACGAHSDAKELGKKIQETVKANSPQGQKPSANGTYLKATIDGDAWEANSMIPDMDPNSSYKRIHGENGDISISFSLWKPTTGDKRVFSEDNAVDFWTSDGIFGGRKGEVVVTRADDKFVEGTFFFSATSDGKTHEVTNGTFRVQATPQPAN